MFFKNLNRWKSVGWQVIVGASTRRSEQTVSISDLFGQFVYIA